MIWKAKNARKETLSMVSSISPTFFTAYFMVIASFSFGPKGRQSFYFAVQHTVDRSITNVG